MIEIISVGGYSEIGMNMSVVRYGNEAVILDMGVHLENYIRFTGDQDIENFSLRDLIKERAVPDDSVIKDIKKNIIAITPSHGHLDHIGAIPYMAGKYNAPVICTPYTASVIQAILKDRRTGIKNTIKTVPNNSKIKLSENITLEFVEITHSIPDTALVVIHTPEGKIVYANDYKLDDKPVIGGKPNYKRIKELGVEGNVKALIIDSLYADVEKKTPSESDAKEMLREVMLDHDHSSKAVVISTFSSHIARLKSIVEFGEKLNRKIVFLGRSLAKYVYAAQDIGMINFSERVEILPYKRQIKRLLKSVEKEGHEKYLIVATGHQGEPNAVLSRIANGEMIFRFREGDHVIFSCTVIPSPLNESNRKVLEEKIESKRAEIFRDVHVSGHAYRVDHRELINMLKPKHIIPAHAGPEKTIHMAKLAEELGYKRGKTVHIMHDGKRIEV